MFEVELQFTEDGILAGLHERPMGDPVRSFSEEAAKAPYTLMTFEDICRMLDGYPDAYIVTDTKEGADYPLIKKEFDEMARTINNVNPALIERFAIQFYNQSMYYFLRDNYNYKSYIYTLEQSDDSDQQVLDFLRKTGVPAVTMPVGRDTADFIGALNKSGIFSFVRSLNDKNEILTAFMRGVYGVYTDTALYSGGLFDADERYPMYKDNIGPDYNKTKLFFKSLMNINNAYSVICSNKDTSTGLEGYIESLGLNPNVNYLAAILQNGLILKKSEGANTAEAGLTFNDHTIKAICGSGGVLSVKIDGYECIAGKNMMNIAIFDSMSGDLIYKCVFDNAGAITEEDAGRIVNQFKFARFLESIKTKDNIIIFSIKDEGANSLNQLIQDKLFQLGLKENLIGKYRQGYAAVLDGGDIVFEQLCGKTGAVFNDLQADGYHISVGSSGYEGLDLSSIKINGKEYSKGLRGMNIVVIDKQTGAIRSMNADTCERLVMTGDVE